MLRGKYCQLILKNKIKYFRNQKDNFKWTPQKYLIFFKVIGLQDDFMSFSQKKKKNHTVQLIIITSVKNMNYFIKYI